MKMDIEEGVTAAPVQVAPEVGKKVSESSGSTTFIWFHACL